SLCNSKDGTRYKHKKMRQSKQSSISDGVQLAVSRLCNKSLLQIDNLGKLCEKPGRKIRAGFFVWPLRPCLMFVVARHASPSRSDPACGSRATHASPLREPWRFPTWNRRAAAGGSRAPFTGIYRHVCAAWKKYSDSKN